MKIVIIVPVYNEADGITDFLSNLKQYVDKISNHEISVLIFDSHSTDDTLKIVTNFQKTWPKLLYLVEAKKTGLGSAYLQGMRYAIDQLNAEAVFQCDADGSHHPQYIEKLIQALEEGNDVAVGSRYIKGGAIDADWAWYRFAISAGGNLLARLVLSNRYKDYTSGFKLIRTTVLKPLLDKTFFSKQYAFQINLLWFLHKAHAKIKEIPILFTDREKGYSKFPRNNIMQSLYVLLMLRIQDAKNYFKMCFCGLFGFFVQLLVFNLLRIKLTPTIANAIAVELVIILNFFTNNFFSFTQYRLRSHYPIRLWLRKFLFFIGISHGSLVLQTIVLILGNSIIGSSIKIDNGLLIMGILLGTVWNYYFYNKLIWKNHQLDRIFSKYDLNNF